MSLSKIGKATTLAKTLEAFKSGGSITDTISALKAFGNVDVAAKYMAQNKSSLPDATLVWMLQQAYGKNSSVENAMQTALADTVNIGSKFSMSGMLGSLSAVGTGIATMFESIAPVIIPLIIAAVAAKAGKMAWDNFATNNAAKKQYQTSSKAYQEAASERDSVQSEYDSNKERIQELRAKANRTVDESKELSNLQNQNDLLNSQLSVKNQIADTAQKQAALDAKTALEKGSYRSGGLLNMDYDSDLEHASDLMHEIQVNQHRKSRLEKNRSDYSDSYWSDYQKEEREIANYDKTINSQKSDLSDLMTTISDTSQDFWDEQGNLVDESTRDTANKVKKLANDYTSITGVSDIDSKMNNLFARSQFKDVKDQLLDIGKKQGSKGIESKIDEIDGLKSALDDAGISIDDFTSELMAMADPDAKNLEGIKENLKDIFGEIKDTDGNSLYDFFKDKSNKDIEGYYDYFLNQGLNPQTSDYTWKKEDIENSYNDYLKSKEKIDPESALFSSKFKNSAEDTATDLDTITDNFQTDMSNIKSSMDSIKSGTFQNSDITDLIQQFPELATETDNLQQGLQNLAFDKASDAIGKIRDSVKDVTDPKQLAAADKYVQSIMDTIDLSGFDMSNAKSVILGNLTKNLADKHMASVTTPNLVNQLISEYGNDEVAVQAIMKLSLDPSMANADLDTWKSKIEDTKVQIQLDTSAKNLDSLSKELTRLQTDASDQQTRLNNKASFNQKATASDYNDLIKNGDKQIENLNNQIQEYQNSIDALKKSKGLSSLSAEDNEQIKQWQDQIQAANMSIENMQASKADWFKTAFNLPVTDMQNTTTALTTAISEMQTETGLTADTMDSLRTQFSDLKKAKVDTVFDRTAKGLKINTTRMKDYLEQQNKFMNSDFANRIQRYQEQLDKGDKNYTPQGLENLKNLQAQYYAQYQEAAKQFSNFQAMVNADNLATEGNEYTTAKSYLETGKDLLDKKLVGTPQFKAIAKYFSQNGFEDYENFQENYNRLKGYYTDDTSGPLKFLNDLKSKGLATYKALEDGSYSWQMTFSNTESAADAMGMSLESFESIFGRLEDYGFTNPIISSLEEGNLKSDELSDKLVDAQIKMGEMKASGASQSALDDQQAVIDDLISQQEGISQAMSDYTAQATDRQVQDIQKAKGAIDELSQYMKDNGISKDSEEGKKYIEAIQEQADKVGIKLTSEFEIDEAAYNEMIESYEAKAKGAQVKHFQDVNNGIESGDTGDYSDSEVELVNKIKDAQEQKSEALQNVIDAVNSLDKDQWKEASQIELGNGAYESEDEGIRNVENALQGLSDQFGLTKEQAASLLPALEALGVVNIDPNVDMTGLDELDQATQDGMSKLREMQDSGDIKLSFDIDSNTDGLTVNELQSQIKELENTKVDIKAKFGVDSSEYQAIQSMIDQREMQMHVRIALDKDVDIDKLLSLSDAELAKKAELDVDVNTEDGKAKVDELRSSIEALSSESADLTVKIDESQFNELTKAIDTDTVDLTVNVHDDQLTKLKSEINSLTSGDKSIAVKADVPGGAEKVTELSSAINQVLPRTVRVKADVKGTDDVNDLSDAITQVLPKIVRVGADVFGTSAVNSLVSAINSVHDKTATVTVTTNNVTNNFSKSIKLYTGTALAPAHASGTAYNVLNTIPMSSAFANGKIGLSEDQEALVNELGTESVIRGDKWFLLPGGMHTENLKKGDIVLNHKQTADLIKGGKAFGHARAYANGTVDDFDLIGSAFGNGHPGGNFAGNEHNPSSTSIKGSSNSSNSGNTQLQKTIDNNTDAVSDASDTVSEAADEVNKDLQKAIKKLNDNAMDWIETAMDHLDRTTSEYTDYAESDFSHYKKSNKNYDNAIKSTEEEITAANTAIQKYWDYAQSVAADPEVSKYLTPELKEKIDNGKTIDIETLSVDQKAAVDAYKTWIDKRDDAKVTKREKEAQRLELIKAKVDNVYDSYGTTIGKREAMEGYWKSKAENRVTHGASQKTNSLYYKDLKKERNYAVYQKDWMTKEQKKVKEQMANYLNAEGTSRKDKAYQNMKKEYIELKTSIVDMDTHIAELNQTLQDTRENVKQWNVDRWDRAGAKQDAAINYKLATDKKDRQISEKDYTERIKTDNRQILALQKLREEKAEYYDTHFKSMNNEEAQKYLDAIAQIDEQILNLGTDIEGIKDKIMELRWKPFNELQEDLSNVVDEYQTAQKLLGDSDSFYNDDGSFTTNGLTNILLTQESIDTTKDKIANYQVALKKLDKQYANGCYSADEYRTKHQELLKGLQQESATLADLKQNMLDMYTTQVTKENDLLQENIEKRKDALSAKEKYYDYDKTLKKKTKDINTLKAQIAALEGTSNAASKARLEKLRAELSDAEDDMADTMHQHEVDMKNTGYENFSNEANKALENTLDSVKKNSAFQEAIIGSMLDTVTADYDSTYKHLHEVMDQYGMKVSQVFDTNISKVADFNREAGKAADLVNKINTSKVPGTENTKADEAVDKTLNNNSTSDDAKVQEPGKVNNYEIKLNAKEIYLTYSHAKYSLKATWSPSKPHNSQIQWTSSNESIATVSSDGTVRGVAAALKNGLMSRDESKTQKCVVTAAGVVGKSAECTVHVMPDSHYEAIKAYADKAGIDTSKEGNNIRSALEYAYNNGAFRSNQSNVAKEGFKKAYLKDWFKSLPDRPNGATDVPAGTSALAGYFFSKGKKVGHKEMQQLADILEIKTPGADKYDYWGTPLKNKILNAYKSYGFSKGGVVRGGIPASILDMIGADALIPRGDSTLIGANPGETVLTKEFTDQLKPTVATLNEFNSRMAQPITPVLPSSSGDTNVNSECNITINVEKIDSEQDIKKLAYKIGDIIADRSKRNMRKL